MKNFKKSSIFVILFLVICMALTTVAFASADAEGVAGEVTEAADGVKLDKDMSGEDMSFGERLEYALQGTVTGMVMVFAVLGLLYGIIALSKVVFYDIPEKKRMKKQKAHTAPVAVAAPTPAPAVAAEESAVQDDGELIAVITAAVAAMIESGDYKNEFVGGFRVVSFKRSAQSAWNRK